MGNDTGTETEIQEAPSSVPEIARGYRDGGLSIIPIWANGSKVPALRAWKPFQERRASDTEMRSWFFAGHHGIAVVCGAISGCLEVYDFDRPGLFEEFAISVEFECPGLLARLPLIGTPDGGNHLYTRSAKVEGNQELAKDTNEHALIQTRGEGGYVLAPGCPAQCHPTREVRETYVHLSGPPITETPPITDAERKVLMAAARALNEFVDEDEKVTGEDRQSADGDGLLPGTDFNRRTSERELVEMLVASGWEKRCESRGVVHLRRPGKTDPGWSATVGHCSTGDGVPLFYVFSSNAAPFEAGKCYAPFAVYALLHCGGDFKAAARQLASKGFGSLHAQATAAAEPKRIAGPLGLALVFTNPPRRTPTRFTAAASVELQGSPSGRLRITDTTTGLEKAARLLCDLLTNPPADAGKQIRSWLMKVIEEIHGDAQQPPGGGAGRKTMLEICHEFTKAEYDVWCLDEKGRAWDEKRRRWIEQRQATMHTPQELIDRLCEAEDAPRDEFGRVKTPGLVTSAQRLLAVSWSTMLRDLKDLADSNLDANSECGRRWRTSLVKVFRKPLTFEVSKSSDARWATESKFATAANLIGRVMTKAGDLLAKRMATGGWERAHPAFDFYWRLETAVDQHGEILTDETGKQKVILWLAMKHTLPAQAREEIPGTHSAAAFRQIADKFGVVADPARSPTAALSGGKRQLVVLDQGFTEELVEEP